MASGGCVGAGADANRVVGVDGLPAGVVLAGLRIAAGLQIDGRDVRLGLVGNRVGEDGDPPHQRLTFVIGLVGRCRGEELFEWPSALQSMVDHRHEGRPPRAPLDPLRLVGSNQLDRNRFVSVKMTAEKVDAR